MKARLPSSLGASHYFPAKACLRGHLAPKSKQNDQCEECHRKWRRRKKGLFIGGGENPDQFTWPAILTAALRPFKASPLTETPATAAPSRPQWRQRFFSFFLPVLQWENP
jgi:hypothetical protein